MLKTLLFGLLAANTVHFALSESPSKGIDAAAWFALLLLFEAENRLGRRFDRERWKRPVLRLVRLVAGAAVVIAMVGYLFEHNTLDAVNSVLWIGVVVMLELEVRIAPAWRRSRALIRTVTFALYGALAVPVGIWTLRGEWFDAYDALLWLSAFVWIELDVLARHRAGPLPGAAKAA